MSYKVVCMYLVELLAICGVGIKLQTNLGGYETKIGC
jgi:hypothetical protein